MAREIQITGIAPHANGSPCFHHCRYCQLTTSRAVPVAFERYEALVHRLLHWREQSGRGDFGVFPWYGNSHDHPPAVQQGLKRLRERMGVPERVPVLLGGVAHRPPQEMRAWLQEAMKLGTNTLVATFAGQGATHDYWNNKQGNYRFQLESLALGARLGLHLEQRVLLLRSALPTLETLFDDLDALPAPSCSRWAIPLFYSGRARWLEEAQRLTRDEFEALSPRIRSCLRDDHAAWLTEGEWVRRIGIGAYPQPERVYIRYPITEATLAWAEDRSCADMIATLEGRWHDAYRQLPSTTALCEAQGDARGAKVYLNLGQLEQLWIERHLEQHPRSFDCRDTAFG